MAKNVILSLKQGVLRGVLARHLKSKSSIEGIECPWNENESIHQFEIALILKNILNQSSTDVAFSRSRLTEFFHDSPHEVVDAPILITNIEANSHVPPQISRWLTEFPNLIVVGVHWESALVQTFRQIIEVCDSGESVSGILDALKACLDRCAEEEYT